MPVTSLNPDHAVVSAAWRILAVFCAVLLLVGYMILAVATSDTQDKLRIDITGSIICAFVFLGSSYTASALIIFRQRHQKHFLIRYVFGPYSIMNLLGLFNALFHIIARSLHLSTLRVMTIGLPAAFSAIYPLGALFIYYDKRSGRHQPEDGTPLLSDEELQRRQMLRLLQDRSSAPSPDLIRNTYRFDLPQYDAAPRYWSERVMRAP